MVSIVIPNYNNTTYLKEMVECIKNQTYSNWELIIVDDVSTDGSYEYAKKLSVNEKRIKVIQRDREPKGGQTCRNIGLETAGGDYVIFWDSDDLVALNNLSQRVIFLDDNPDLDFGVFPTHSFKPRKDYFNLHPRDVVWGKKAVDDPIDGFLRNEYPYLVVSCIFRRDAIKNLRWDEKANVRQDMDFNLSVLFAGLKYKFCDGADYDYFYRGAFGQNNVSKNMSSPDKYKGMIYLFDKILNRISEYDFSSKNKYHSALKRYLVHYHNSLVCVPNESLCRNFTEHFRGKYGKWFLWRLDFIALISTRIGNSKLRYVISYLLHLFLFGYKFYFVLMKKGLLRIFYRK